MNRTIFSVAAVVALVLFGATLTVRAQDDANAKKAPAETPIEAAANKTCPMTGEVNGDSAVTVEHRGKTLTLCCKMCRGQWNKLSDVQRDAKLVEAAQTKKETTAKAATKVAATSGEAYPLAACAVSGRPLDVKGTQTIKLVDGREIRTCCKGCMAAYEKNRAKYEPRLNKMIVDDQLARYPLMTCPISGGKLGGMGKPVDMVVGNRLVRLCCAGCEKKVAADPAKYIAMVDAAAVKAQSKDYPLTTCVVSGKAADSKGKAVDVVVAGRLIRVCCNNCAGKVKKNPASYIAKVDAAAKSAADKK
jgi:hypothetical protein